MIKIDYKPLSVNAAYTGERYKTEAYRSYKKAVTLMLKLYPLPEPPFKITLICGQSSMNYDFLKSLGLITYGTEVRQEIWKDATVRAISIVNDKKSKSDLFIRQALDVLKEKYQAGPDPDTEEYKAIAIEAKYITLCKYFDDIILSKTNFGELVESKREVFYNLKKSC